MVSGISLHGGVVDDDVALNEGLVRLALHFLNRWSVQVDLRVDNQERVVRIDDIVVDANTVQVLL